MDNSDFSLGAKLVPSYFAQYNQFGQACGIPAGSITLLDNAPSIVMSKTLVKEEVLEELFPWLDKYLLHPSIENFVEVADGIVDSVYVLLQLARTLGVPFDEVWEIVHRKNMEKVGPDGQVIRRADGKILKPEGWTPPNQEIWDVLYAKYVLELKKRQGHQQGEVLGDPK